MDISRLPASELVVLIQNKTLSAQEVVRDFLDRIQALNPQYNAVVTLNADAMALAQAADKILEKGELLGPLHGLPITIKDSFCTEGLRTTGGFKPLANYIPKRDAVIVSRLKEAGAIILGKTNVPILSMDVQTENPIFGRTHNPWNIDLVAGGSSGGSAASVAAGLTPLCFGSDIGGSLRIPAHFCGVCSMKPTTRLVSTDGHIPPLPKSAIYPERFLSTPGPIARRVADLALGLKVIAGNTPYTAEIPSVLMNDVPRESLAKLKIAYCHTMGNLPIEPAYASSFTEFIHHLSEHSMQVQEAFPEDFDMEEVWKTYGGLLGNELGAGMPYVIYKNLGMSFRTLTKKCVLSRAIFKGAHTGLKQFFINITKRDHFIQSLERFFDHYDVLISPVCTLSAFEHQTPGKPIQVADEKLAYFTASMSFVTPFNLTGHPVVTLPIGITSENKPVGVQIIGKRWNDLRLLAIAEQIERIVNPVLLPL